MNSKAGNLMKSFALFAARRSNTGEITISIIGDTYLFWRYLGYLDAKEAVRREHGLNQEGEGSHDIQR